MPMGCKERRKLIRVEKKKKNGFSIRLHVGYTAVECFYTRLQKWEKKSYYLCHVEKSCFSMQKKECLIGGGEFVYVWVE